MEYIFGTNGHGPHEVLRTKGDVHTNFSGFTETTREFQDSKITDFFYVVEHIKSDEDPEGNCYDWYVIDRHYRYVDKSAYLLALAEARKESMENALCEHDMLTEARVSALEDAICELDSAIND